MADLPAAKRVSSTSPIPSWFTGANPNTPFGIAQSCVDGSHVFRHITIVSNGEHVPVIRYPDGYRVDYVEITCYAYDYYNTDQRQYTIKIDRNHLRLVQALIPKRARELLDEYDTEHATTNLVIPIVETSAKYPEDWTATITVYFEGASPDHISMDMYAIGRKIYIPVGDERHRPSQAANVIWDSTTGQFVPPPDCDQLAFALRNHRLQEECCGLPVSREVYGVPIARYTVYRASFIDVKYH